MKLNISFKDFKKNHTKNKNQIIFTSKKCNDYTRVENLFKFLLVEKNLSQFPIENLMQVRMTAIRTKIE